MRFNGVILPDFSLFRDMPLVMQMYNILRSRDSRKDSYKYSDY